VIFVSRLDRQRETFACAGGGIVVQELFLAWWPAVLFAVVFGAIPLYAIFVSRPVFARVDINFSRSEASLSDDKPLQAIDGTERGRISLSPRFENVVDSRQNVRYLQVSGGAVVRGKKGNTVAPE
jgi:hypothetical protein